MISYLECAKNVLDIEKQAIERVSQNLGSEFIASIDLLLECINNKGKIVVVGVGKSGNIGYKIAATLNSTGATAVVLNSQDALHGDLGLLDQNDVVLAMSYSGETPELINLLPHLKKLEIKIVALTSKPKSTLGKHADYVLDTSVEKEACPLNLAPTSSSTAMLVLGDAIAMVLLEARGFTKEEFARFHPGGTLGKALLTSVTDIMRSGDEIAMINQSGKVLQALKEMSDKKTGACIIMNGEDMAGILTHGDFVRSYTQDHTVGEKNIKEVMTKNPISITEGLLAVEAIAVLREHRIDDLVVLSKDGKPIGIIDSQDLAKHKLI